MSYLLYLLESMFISIHLQAAWILPNPAGHPDAPRTPAPQLLLNAANLSNILIPGQRLLPSRRSDSTAFSLVVPISVLPLWDASRTASGSSINEAASLSSCSSGSYNAIDPPAVHSAASDVDPIAAVHSSASESGTSVHNAPV